MFKGTRLQNDLIDLLEGNFSKEDRNRIQIVYDSCDIVYGHNDVRRKSGTSYWKHIDGCVRAFLEDGFRDTSTLIGIIVHDFKEEGAKVGFKEAFMNRYLKDSVLLSPDELEMVYLHDEQKSNDKIERLKVLFTHPQVARLVVGKSYDICDNSMVDVEYIPEKSRLIKVKQAEAVLVKLRELDFSSDSEFGEIDAFKRLENRLEEAVVYVEQNLKKKMVMTV